jgi:hypothetical protein
VVTVLLAVLVFSAAAGLDFCATKYVRSVQAGRAWSAAMWSVLQWSAATIAFVVAVKVSLWLLPFEALGLATGTLLGMRSSRLPKGNSGVRLVK